MPVFRTAFNGYSVKFSPFLENRLAVPTSQNFGMVGNGRQYILDLTPNGLVQVAAFDTPDSLYDCSWSEENENILVSASGDGSIKVWDLSAPPMANPVSNRQEHAHEVASVDWNMVRKDSFLSSSWDDTIRVGLSHLGVKPPPLLVSLFCLYCYLHCFRGVILSNTVSLSLLNVYQLDM